MPNPKRKLEIKKGDTKVEHLQFEYPFPKGKPFTAKASNSSSLVQITNHSHGIYTINKFLLPSLCYNLLLETIPKANLERVFHLQTKEITYRSHYRSKFTSIDLAKDLWSVLLPTVQQENDLANISFGGHELEAHGLNPNFRLYRYSAGDAFGAHYDEEADDGTHNIGGFTLLLYLSGTPLSPKALNELPESRINRNLLGLEIPYSGGCTSFHTEGKSNGKRKSQIKDKCILIEPMTGKLLLHRQGRYCLLHEGALVESGIKWVLRSDIMYSL